MSLRDPTRKMSKSDNDDAARINLSDTPDVIKSKVSRAVTDSIRGITLDPENRPGVASLVSILAYTTDRTPAEVAESARDWNNARLKAEVTDALVAQLTPIRKRLDELRRDPQYVDDILRDGRDRASEIAHDTMREVRRLVGWS